MYGFIDTTEVFGSATLPSEALKINGEYIEHLIPGYRTLSVSGREALSTELSTFETGSRDGSTLKNRRFPARTIVVKYQLLAESSGSFREAYNKLAKILNVEDAELIFNDEQDKFFKGTPSAFKEIEPGSNCVVGEFEIFCADPFKYSATEYEIEPTALDDGSNVFIVDYKGTYKAYPRLEAKFYSENEADGDTVVQLTGSGDCGYVAYFNENGKMIQLGDPDEVDSVHDETIPKAQTLTNQLFNSSSSWGSAAQGLWALNEGATPWSDLAQAGSVKIGSHNGMYHLTAADYGTGSGWHGPSITRRLPSDASGEAGAKNFFCSFAPLFSNRKLNGELARDQFGGFQIMILSGTGENRKVLAGISYHKGGETSETVNIYVNDKLKDKSNGASFLHLSKYGTIEELVKWSSIEKSGNRMRFTIGDYGNGKGGASTQLTCYCYDEGFEDMAATEVVYTFFKYGDKPALEQNGLWGIKFIKNNCSQWKDVPNKFSPNDILVADCGNGTIFLNNIQTPGLGALGNDWEEFYLKPGTNQIGMAYSEWLQDDYAPAFKMRYREVFL